MARIASKTNCTVLITGESGAFTGAKKNGAPGKFELANGGAIFLYEIGDMSFDLQVCLLRFLQEQEITRIGGKKTIKLNVRVMISEFDAIVEGATNPPNEVVIDADPTNEKYSAIGGYLSELIEDGATIEIGIGRLNSAAMLHLDGVKDLGIHTEIFGDAMMDLIETGIVTNERKSINKGINICCQVVGSRKLYDFVAHNHSINMMPSTYALNPGIIAQNNKMTAINNAINVDLFGQVNAESLKNRQFTGMGGIGDFSKGATLCPNGKSIIVVESTTKDDRLSKIVSFFTPGTPVSVPRTDIEYVVTEYGIAKLAGASINEKARALINIAHPKFRDELIEEAKKMNIN